MLQGFKQSPPEPSVKVIHTYFDRLEVLQQLGVTKIDLSDIHPKLIEELCRLTNTYNVWDLRRLLPEKRYALLACFLTESYRTLLDHIVKLNDKMLANKERQSRHTFQKKFKASRRKARENEKIMIAALEDMYQNANSKDLTLPAFIEQLNNEKIKQAIAQCKSFHRYEEEGVLQELNTRYSHLRKYTPRFFKLDFKAAKGSDNLFKAIDIIRQLNDGTLKDFPEDTPCDFVPVGWRGSLYHSDGSIRQRTWELALYYAVKQALTATNLHLPHSRDHRNFWETIYSEQIWQQEGPGAYEKLKLPNQFDNILSKLNIEFKNAIELAKKNLSKDSFAYIGKNGELKLRRDDALEIPASTKKLRQQIQARLPIIRIEKLLEEVDEAIHFSKCFVPQKGFNPKLKRDSHILHAALLAQATNMGLYGMQHSAEGILINDLREVDHWLIYGDSLKTSNTHLVNAHYNLPISRVFGDPKYSSSDAKRYAIRTSSLLASYYPRYYGYYDKAISVYTHTSSLFSVFNTLVISCGVREATYVLTGLLSNDSLINSEFHCTDTAGFTHHVFALCYLLGFSFQPRLKDLASQRLFKIDKKENYGEIDSLFAEAIDVDLIREQWDNLVKITASLKNGLAPAHVIIGKLANRTTDRSAKALMELGKIIKTIFILQYISDPELRHTIQLQLNRGEHRHFLAQHVFFADQGTFKTSDYEKIMNKASCLSFVSNAILYWNTVQFSKIVDQLIKEGYPVNDEDLARISPLIFKHIIVHGTYHFNNRWKGEMAINRRLMQTVRA